MGRHAGTGTNHKLAPWLIAVIVAALVAALVVVGYIVVIQRADSADEGACQGAVFLPIAAGPHAAPAVRQAAEAYNKTGPVARSSCVTASVTVTSDRAALHGLTGSWPTESGPAPGLWIPDNAAFLTALDKARPDLAAGHSTDPVAWSPVVLAVHRDDVPAVGSLAWSDLPDAAGPDGTAALPGGRHLILALPPVSTNRASSYALQSILAGDNPNVPVDAQTIAAHTSALQALQRDAADRADNTSAALARLQATAPAGGTTDSVGGSANATAEASTGATTEASADAVDDHDGIASAVPAVEVDVARFDTREPDAGLVAVHPKGKSVGDALIPAPISATWTDRTVIAAAGDFKSFLTSTAGQQILADAGWRTVSAHPAKPLAEVDTTAKVTMMPAGGPAVEVALATALGQPVPEGSTGSSTSDTAASGTPTSPSPSASLSESEATDTTASPPSAPATPPTTTKPTRTSPTMNDDGPVLTLIVDTSSGMAGKNDGKTLLTWVKKALPDVMNGSVTNRVGLWAYSDGEVYPPNGFPELVSTGPLTDKVTVPADATDDSDKTATELRSKALTDAVAGLSASGERWAYGAVMEALTKVPDARVKGRDSRVVLFTSGVDETPGTPRTMVLDAMTTAKKKHIRVDVVGLGGAVPVDAYTDIASATGGEYIPATTPKKLAETLTDLLTLDE